MNKMVFRKKYFYSITLLCVFSLFFIFWILLKGQLRFFDPLDQSDIYTYIKNLDFGIYHYRLSTQSLSDGIFVFLFNEPLWTYIVVGLNYFFNSDDVFLFVIPILVVFFTSIYLNFNSGFLYVIALFHPISTAFQLNQLRLALAMSFFLFFWFVFKNKRVLLFVSMPLFLIHTSMLFFIAVFFICYYVCNIESLSSLKKVFLLIFFGFLLAYITGPAVGDVLSMLGDRRAEIYTGDTWQTSFLTSTYCLAFVLLMVYYHFSSNHFVRIEVAVSIVFFSLVFFSYFFTGGYPMRFLSAVFPVLIVGGSKLSGIYKKMYFIMFFLIGAYILIT